MISVLIMDVDGTLTDGKVYIGDEGEVFKAFNIKDGYGIAQILPQYNIIPMILTGRNSVCVGKRAEELGIKQVYQGVCDKRSFIKEWLDEVTFIGDKTVAYIGDDDNDLDAMRYIKDINGIIACPSDASRNARDMADYKCQNKGGDGAVREFIDYLIDILYEEKNK